MVLCGTKYSTNTRLDGKTVIVTGSSSGIGRETVLDFYRRGGRVIMACRNVEKAETVKKEIVESLKKQENLGEIIVKCVDVSSMASVRKFAQEILDEEPQVNILVNNAGIMMSPFQRTEDDFELQLATNHFGHFLLTLMLLPRILKSAPARIINVSSKAYDWGDGMDFNDLNWKVAKYSPAAAYGRSKLANILFTMELGKRLEGTNVTTYCLHPGVVDTEVTQHFGDTVFPGAQTLFRAGAKLFIKTPVQGAQTTIYCALDEKLANETGFYYADCKKSTVNQKANMIDAKKLWDASVELVGLQDYDPFTAVDNGPKKA